MYIYVYICVFINIHTHTHPIDVQVSTLQRAVDVKLQGAIQFSGTFTEAQISGRHPREFLM